MVKEGSMKPGMKTTEFWMTAISQLIAAALATGAVPHVSEWTAVVVAVGGLLSAQGYTWARTFTKQNVPTVAPTPDVSQLLASLLSKTVTENVEAPSVSTADAATVSPTPPSPVVSGTPDKPTLTPPPPAPVIIPIYVQTSGIQNKVGQLTPAQRDGFFAQLDAAGIPEGRNIFATLKVDERHYDITTHPEVVGIALALGGDEH
jgi:hypothetical protein